MKSIIPAAGLGTRFLPGTKVTPKEMLPVLDKPVIQYVVEEALAPEEVDEMLGKLEFTPDRDWLDRACAVVPRGGCPDWETLVNSHVYTVSRELMKL